MEYLGQSKDPKIKQAHEVLDAIFKSPYFDSYITLKGQMSRWNKEILEKKVKIVAEEEKDDSFKNVHNYFKELSFYTKSLEELEKKLLPDEVKKVEKDNKPKSMEEIMLGK
jgi:uncharacterized membrane protein